MIGWLSGRVRANLASRAVLLDVHGVGYELQIARADAPQIGDELELFVHTAVRADAILLFGFASLEEREVFELLLATPGVGPSTALGALRTFSLDALLRAIEGEDVKLIATIPGVGQKTASRIVLELKGRLVSPVSDDAASGVANNAVIEDALRALGYHPSEVREALRDATLSDDEPTALREALALLRRA
ncbi:MAG TPA: Holliday junction branch migration protein RuvA [Acidimicrobiales bacterium]